MKLLRTAAAGLALAASLTGAAAAPPAPKKPAEKASAPAKETRTILGKWKLVAMRAGDEAATAGEEKIPDAEFVFKADGSFLSHRFTPEGVLSSEAKGVYRIDLDATPKRLHFMETPGPDEAEPDDEETETAGFEVRGDVLVLFNALPAPEGSEVEGFEITLHRVAGD